MWFVQLELEGLVCRDFQWVVKLLIKLKVVFGCWNGNGNARKQDYAEMTMNWYLIALRLEPYWFCLCSILFRWRLVSRPLWSIAGQVMLHLREPNAGKCSHFEQPLGLRRTPVKELFAGIAVEWILRKIVPVNVEHELGSCKRMVLWCCSTDANCYSNLRK